MSYWSTKTEEEANAKTEASSTDIELIAGDYDFYVWKYEEGITANGNRKLTLTLIVTISNGSTSFCDVVVVDHPKMFFLRKNFWKCVGEPGNINSEPSEYSKKRGKCRFECEEYYSKKYGINKKKLVVKDFIEGSHHETIEEKLPAEDSFPDDEIPF